MTIDKEIKEMGHDLLQFAKSDADFTAQRGIVDDLFPYIYQASKRMSTRAISRWLEEVHDVKLSAVTIAKALRESNKYWELFWERIEPSARIFEEAHDVDMKDFLFDVQLFRGLRDGGGNVAVSGAAGYKEYQRACEVLNSEWFVFNKDVWTQCWGYMSEGEPEKVERDNDKKFTENASKGDKK